MQVDFLQNSYETNLDGIENVENDFSTILHTTEQYHLTKLQLDKIMQNWNASLRKTQSIMNDLTNNVSASERIYLEKKDSLNVSSSFNLQKTMWAWPFHHAYFLIDTPCD